MDNNYFQNEQKKFEDISEAYRKDANDSVSGLSKHLILASTVIIGLSSPLFSSKDILKEVILGYKIVLFSGLIAFILSIAFGIAQFSFNYWFFRKWVNGSSDIIAAISKKEVGTKEELDKRVNDIQKNLPLESPTWTIYTQSALLFVGVVLFIVFVSRLLFKF